jgi:hypothetical protein
VPRKVFVAGEILTAADVNTNLMDQAVMVFDDAAARGSAIPSPSEGMVTYLKDLNKIQQYTTDWEDVGRAGIGPNVVQTVLASTFNTSSPTQVAVTGLAVTITPSTATAKILVLVSLINVSVLNNNSQFTASITATSGSAPGNIAIGYAASANQVEYPTSASIVHSPATTSPVTYQVQVGRSFGTGAVEVPAGSKIQVIEVAG